MYISGDWVKERTPDKGMLEKLMWVAMDEDIDGFLRVKNMWLSWQN